MRGDPQHLRILSYNVRSLRDDRAALVRVIRAVAPDVACVQEVPRFWGWRRALRALAADCGLAVASGGRPAAEVAVLTRPGRAVTQAGASKLPWHPPKHRRGVAWAVVDGILVASTHLSLDGAERLDQARRVLALLDRLGHPAVLAGDVNEEPGGPAWDLIAHRLPAAHTGPTLPAYDPRRRIDGIFADPRLTVGAAAVVAHPDVPRASDHCPVSAVVTVS